ncbi:uncharacterized protein BX663DRAFT_515900 [Cokeromyces recurvatus]|uniref:uncharacterized protein n=1 Tax=Cokeromyces recurvatus TaxID=90255 RepID=UPI002220C51C|nr:uncharacterized protein BX663DRAFT_515900 [Cokeromyces recurvatus]KAI7900978.1 hypothetical protein BX663DRAFT_515900 [Cokeromyces recurvatus]
MTRSSPWSDLSIEILQLIFSYNFSNIDLHHCQLVCKSWSRAAHYTLYSQIFLTSLPKALRFLHTLNTLPSFGLLVKQIIFSNQVFKRRGYPLVSFEEWDIYRIFDNLGELCPNVQKVEMRFPDRYYWMSLARGRKLLGHWKRLKEVQLPLSGFEEEMAFVDSVMAFKDTLEELVVNLDYHKLAEERYYTVIWQNLGQFVSLKRLDLHQMTQTGNLVELEQKMKELSPTVSSVSFGTYTEKNIFESKPHNLSLVRSCPYVRSLKVNTVIIDNNAIDYLMHKFPHLSHLTLNTGCDNMTNWFMYLYGSFELCQTSKFIHYLDKMHSFDMILAISNVDDLLHQLINKYCDMRFILSFEDCFYLDDCNMNEYHKEPIIKLERKQSTITATLYFVCEQPEKTMQTYIKRYGNQIRNYLEIRNMQQIYLLNDVLEYCTNLKTLHLVGYSNLTVNSQIVINKSIEELILDNCTEDIYKQLSKQLPQLK